MVGLSFGWFLLNFLNPVINPDITGGYTKSGLVSLVANYNPGKVIAGYLSRTNFVDDMTPYPTRSNVITPSLGQAKKYLRFSAGAYCNGWQLTDWNCIDCRATGPDVQFIAEIYNRKSKIRAIFLAKHETREIILAYRGSINARNFIQDFAIDLIRVPGRNDNIKVHRGAWNNLMSIYDRVEKTLGTLHSKFPKYSVVITGHSLGGMLATLSLFKLKTTPEFANLIYSLYTYGQPRTGNLDFALWVNSQKIPVIRVVATKDNAPHFPIASTGFVQHLQELWINGTENKFCSKEVLEDPTCSNSLGPNYKFSAHLFYWDSSIPPMDCILQHPISYLRRILK